jgi:exosortase K
VRAKVGVLIVSALAAWGMKRHYAAGGADDLWWVLAPTAALVETLTGATFTVAPGEGYFSRERLFLIEKSCAGINFMIAAFGMLVFALLHRVAGGRSAARVLGVSLGASYVSAVLVNAVRIAIAMWMPGDADVHRIQGITIYFGGLVVLYQLVQRLDDARRHTALPLAAYYAVTLALPLANGAVQSGARFVEHALVVLVVPLVLMAMAAVVRHRC